MEQKKVGLHSSACCGHAYNLFLFNSDYVMAAKSEKEMKEWIDAFKVPHSAVLYSVLFTSSSLSLPVVSNDYLLKQHPTETQQQ